MRATKNKVLVFDSGVGGLSVFQEIRYLLPELDYLYLFDNQAYPYGELDQEVLVTRVNQLVSKLVAQCDVDIVVIACNTASTVVLPSLRKNLSIPVVGVVPAIKPATLISSLGIGLVATPATITRQYTHELIRDFSNGKTVELLGSTRLVDMAEAKLRGQKVPLSELEIILAPLRNKVDVVVLGCTHFPLIKDEIATVLGESVTIVDSGRAIAKRVEYLLEGYSCPTNTIGSLKAYSSASLAKEEALLTTFHKMGFSSINHFPLRDV